MADNLEYVCKECGFNWITLNGEHEMCPKCHSTTIEYIGEVKDLDIDSILNHNKRMGGRISHTTRKNAADIGYAKKHTPF